MSRNNSIKVSKNAKTKTDARLSSNFLMPIQNDIELNTPVFLVDTSGSTDSSLDGQYSYNRNEKKFRVLDYEIQLIGKISENRGYDTVHVILWSNRAFLFQNVKVDPENLSDSLEHIILQANENKSGTHLMSGFKKLEESMYEKGKQTDLIIITDGEIMDSDRDIGVELRKITENNVSLSIVAVERGNKDYLQANCEVGNKLYSVIQNHNLTRFVNKFSIYNNLRTEFVNFVNPIVPESYVPYGEMMFARSDFKDFVIYVDSELDDFVRKEGLMESDIMRHAHRLSMTIYHYLKGNTQTSQKGLVELFVKMYQKFDKMEAFRGQAETIYEKVRKLLINEVDNHVAGKSTTFTSARRHRSRKVEDTNLDLMSNVSTAIMGDEIDDNAVFYTMPIRVNSDDGKMGIRIYEVRGPKFSDYAVGKTAFKKGCVRIGRYDLPLLFPIGQGNKRAANQWIRTVYSRTLNVSPSNPFIYYYVMMDCLVIRQSGDERLIALFESYLSTFLNEEVFDSDRKFIDTIVYNEKVKLKYHIMKGAQLYSGLGMNPLTLFWLACNIYIVPHFTTKTEEEKKKRMRFVQALRSMCAKQVFMDLITDISRETYKDTPSSELVDKVSWDTVLEELEDLIGRDPMSTPIRKSVMTVNLLQMPEHKFVDSFIVCPGRSMIVSSDVIQMREGDQTEMVCDICGSTQMLQAKLKTNPNEYRIEETNLSKSMVFGEWKNPIIDSALLVHLGLLTGENTDTELISPENFEPGAEFVEMHNILITDPISSSKMRVTTQNEFKSNAHAKYPFLKDLKFDNVALAGGFCRSILLKQEMKDFDFFFYGLNGDAVYEERFQEFVTDLVNSVRKTYHLRKQNVKFFGMFKPTYNVFELICFVDPTNHINSEFDLKNFHENDFMSLCRYNGNVDAVGEHDTPYVREVEDDESSDSSELDDSDDSDDSDESDYEYRSRMNHKTKAKTGKAESTYFEDGDSKGIRMIHRFQFILCKYDSKFGITQSFDMHPSKTVFDNDRVYFTSKALVSHQYMINEIMLDGGSDLFKHRVSKYFKYGYSIVLPPNARNWYDDRHQNSYNYVDSYYDGNDENRGPISFEVRRVIDNQIVISHNSNIEKMLERNEELEQNALEDAKSLYVSHLFCSFVSILRYVEINGIDYFLPHLPIVEYDDDEEVTEDSYVRVSGTDIGFVEGENKSRIRFHDRTLDVKYMDRFNTLYSDRKWFDLFYKSMILTDANDYKLDLSDDFVYKGGKLN